jgi:hypothetical protein
MPVRSQFKGNKQENGAKKKTKREINREKENMQNNRSEPEQQKES